MWEAREKGDNGQNQNSKSSFKTERKDPEKTCFGCGKPGHIKANCRNTWSRENSRKNSASGGAYGYGSAHQSYQRRGGSTRGRGSYRRGRGWQQRSEGDRRHDTNYENMGSFCSEVVKNSIGQVEANVSENNRIEWILDSGCTDHIINNESYFTNYICLKNPINVKVGDGRSVQATKVGNIQTYFLIYGKRMNIRISNVFYVREMDRNLLSFAKVTVKNKVISMHNTSKIYNEYNKLIAVAFKENGLYKLRSCVTNKESNVTIKNKQRLTQKEKFHRILGHVNFKYLDMMCKDKLVEGLPSELESEFLKCGTCIQNKMHNLPFENQRNRANDLLDIVHTDLNGPHNTTGNNGENYFLTFIDDYSKAARVYTLKSKTEVYECFVEYINTVENITSKKIKKLRCDNGKEYINKDIFRLAREKGIVIDPCPPYVHQLNGTAERYNRSIMDTARCLLSEARVNKRFWPEIIKTAAYLKNRTLANTIEKKTPYEILTGRKPNISNLRIYGSRVFVRVPEEKRKSKWDRKADLGILLGYENVGYRVLINNKVIIARHVDIIEEDVNLIGVKGEDEENNYQDETRDNEDRMEDRKETLDINKGNDTVSIVSRETPSEQTVTNRGDEQGTEVRRSVRERKKPDRYGEAVAHSNCIYVNFVNADTPTSYEDAINSEDSLDWKQAMNKEITCLMKNKTWTLIDKPKDRKVLDVKWVYTTKADNIKKARLVVRGYQQEEGLDNVYSPVARMQTLKILLAYCCQYGLMILQMDVEAAFLNGKIRSEIYVTQPKGYEDGTDRVCRLDKTLYGLRESPRTWYECLDTYLQDLGFKKSDSDYCLYVLGEKKNVIYLIIFVDDLLICGKNERKLIGIKDKLSNKFKMKDLGEVKTYLGINIKHDRNKNEITLDQRDYIESLARKYGIIDSNCYHTPMEQNLKLEPAQSEKNDVKFRNLIGALLYISTGTRLDISYSVNYLSRFQNCCEETHFKYALRVLKYLYFTRNIKLTYQRNINKDMIDCYVDADWAGDAMDRKSTTGYVIRMYGNVVYWKTRKQGSVTKSSTHAEYVALSESVSEIKVIVNLLKDFQANVTRPINIYEDNSGAMAIAKFGNLTKNSKHIEVHYHFVHECVEEGLINIVKIESENNIADILTKSLGRTNFEKFRTMLKLL